MDTNTLNWNQDPDFGHSLDPDPVLVNLSSILPLLPLIQHFLPLWIRISIWNHKVAEYW